MTRHLHHITVKSPQQHRRQHDSAAPSPARLAIDVTQQLDRQADILPAHIDTIHQYTWFHGQCKCLIALLGTSVMHLCVEDSHMETLDSWVKFPERFNLRVETTPIWCTYLIDSAKKYSVILYQSTWLLKLSTQQIHHVQGRSRSPSIHSLDKHSGADDEDWYLGYHPHELKRPKEGSATTLPTIQKILEDHGMLPKA
jgi:hypothetical protein